MTALAVAAAMALAVACGGSSDSEETAAAASPSVTATPTATRTPTATPTPTPTPTPEPTPPPPTVVDAVYAEPAQESAQAWTLDIYAPSEPADVPAVVLLPGASSTKASATFQQLARDIADLGAVVFLPDFRTGSAPAMFRVENATPLRESTEGVACAIKFARANAVDYGGGSDRVIVVGQSARVALGLLAALIGDDLAAVWDEIAVARGTPLPQLDCVSAEGSAQLDAFVGYGGGYNVMELVKAEDPELAAVMTPDTYIGANTDVVLRFINGTMDTTVPRFLQEQHEALSQTLADAGYDSTWTTVEAGHFLSPFVPASHEAIVAAVADILT